MKKKWLLSLGATVLSVSLLTGCGTMDNNNDINNRPEGDNRDRAPLNDNNNNNNFNNDRNQNQNQNEDFNNDFDRNQNDNDIGTDRNNTGTNR